MNTRHKQISSFGSLSICIDFVNQNVWVQHSKGFSSSFNAAWATGELLSDGSKSSYKLDHYELTEAEHAWLDSNFDEVQEAIHDWD